MSLFQVLIGSLVTEGDQEIVRQVLEFQVLIGSLVTCSAIVTSYHLPSMFQVLIGSLVTMS